MPSRPRRTPTKAAPAKARTKPPAAPRKGSRKAAAKRPAAKTRPSVASAAPNAKTVARAHEIAQAALSKKGEDVVLLDLRGLSSVTDFYVIATGNGPRQVSALADAIDDDMKKKGVHLIGSEGRAAGTWVLLDFGDVVAHLFDADTRAHYDLEGNWADAPREKIEG
jgi:ribosome-associated protein